MSVCSVVVPKVIFLQGRSTDTAPREDGEQEVNEVKVPTSNRLLLQ